MTQLKVVTWNIWGGKNINAIIECLRVANADIVGLQEVLEETDGSGNNAESIARALGYEWVYAPTRTLDPSLSHLLKTHNYSKSMRWGNAVLSRRHIIGSTLRALSQNKLRTAIAANIVVGGEKLSVISTHLAHSAESESVRNDQVETLIKIAPDERAIVMGDFNAAITSIAIHKMREKFIDTMTHSAQATLQESDIERIDYVFITKEIRCIESGVICSDASDHLPVYAIIEL